MRPNRENIAKDLFLKNFENKKIYRHDSLYSFIKNINPQNVDKSKDRRNFSYYKSIISEFQNLVNSNSFAYCVLERFNKSKELNETYIIYRTEKIERKDTNDFYEEATVYLYNNLEKFPHYFDITSYNNNVIYIPKYFLRKTNKTEVSIYNFDNDSFINLKPHKTEKSVSNVKQNNLKMISEKEFPILFICNINNYKECSNGFFEEGFGLAITIFFIGKVDSDFKNRPDQIYIKSLYDYFNPKIWEYGRIENYELTLFEKGWLEFKFKTTYRSGYLKDTDFEITGKVNLYTSEFKDFLCEDYIISLR